MLKGRLQYEEVREALKMLKRGKGVGRGRLSSEMMEILWYNLCKLLECCWNEQCIPREKTQRIIVPLHKGEGDTEEGN